MQELSLPSKKKAESAPLKNENPSKIIFRTSLKGKVLRLIKSHTADMPPSTFGHISVRAKMRKEDTRKETA